MEDDNVYLDWTLCAEIVLIGQRRTKYGINIENPDLLSLNTTFTKAVKNFVTKTNRFLTPD